MRFYLQGRCSFAYLPTVVSISLYLTKRMDASLLIVLFFFPLEFSLALLMQIVSHETNRSLIGCQACRICPGSTEHWVIVVSSAKGEARLRCCYFAVVYHDGGMRKVAMLRQPMRFPFLQII